MERIQYDQHLGLFSKVDRNGKLVDEDKEGSRKRTLNLNNPGKGKTGLQYDTLLRTYSEDEEYLKKYSTSVHKGKRDYRDPFKGLVHYTYKEEARRNNEELFKQYQDLIKFERNLVDASRYPSITFEMLLLYKLTRRYFVGSTYQPEVESKVKVFKEKAVVDEEKKQLIKEIEKVVPNMEKKIKKDLYKLDIEELRKFKKRFTAGRDSTTATEDVMTMIQAAK